MVADFAGMAGILAAAVGHAAAPRRRVFVSMVYGRQVRLEDACGLATGITAAVSSVVVHDEPPVVIPHLGVVADISLKFFEM